MKILVSIAAISVAMVALRPMYIAAADSASAFIRVSPRDPRYFEYTDGRPYIPIGLNLIHPNTPDAGGMARMALWLQRLGTNGGNYARIWLEAVS